MNIKKRSWKLKTNTNAIEEGAVTDRQHKNKKTCGLHKEENMFFWYNLSMTSTQINQENYSVFQPYMLLDFTYSYEKNVDKCDLSRTVMEIMERIDLNKYIDLHNYDKRAYHPGMMLACIILAFANGGYASLRELEELCKYDLRFRAITNNVVPSYKAFERFINKRLKKSIRDISKDIFLFMNEKKELEKETLYVDGTKFEANANKMTFVWKAWKKRYMPRHWQRCMNIISNINRYFKKNDIDVRYSIIKTMSIEYLIEIDERLEEWLKANECIRKGRGKHEIAKLCDELKKSAIKLWEYAIHGDILGERNSYSKTDPDATFMHMKYDYYNHTNVFKPGYNVQIGVVRGYVSSVYISSDGNDMKTLIPLTESYKKEYGVYPNVVVADAGYGSYENYSYCQSKGIEGILKYSGYEKKKEKVNDKNRYRSIHFKKDENKIPICPEGHRFTLEDVKVRMVGVYPKTTKYYRNEHCRECPYRNKCTTSKRGRTVQVTPKLEREHERIDETLETARGKEYMSHRSTDTEGTFGDIKKNFEYVRLNRRGESGVEVEINLVIIGHNIRRYHNEKMRKLRNEQKKN